MIKNFSPKMCKAVELQKLRDEFVKNKKEFEEKQYSMNVDQIILNNILLKIEEDVYYNRFENDQQKSARGEREFMKMFTCCERRFKTFFDFVDHKEVIHEDKQYEEVVLDMNNEDVVFDDAKPYKCLHPKCGKVYSSINGLKYHTIKGHDTDEEDKKYKCSVIGCEKRYKNANGLKYHLSHGH